MMELIESESGQKVQIPRLKPSAAEKRLGIRYSVDGSWNAEFKFWKTYSEEFADKVSKAKLDRLGGYHAYNTLWSSKFRYSAPAITFTPAQLLTIQRKIIGPSLAAAGFNSKMPRVVVFGPSSHGGMNWYAPYFIQLYEQIKLVIGSIRLEDTVGRLLVLQLQWLQVTAGTSIPLLASQKNIPYLPQCWLQSLHTKMVDTKLQILLEKQWVPHICRENDKVIMDYVQHHLPPN